MGDMEKKPSQKKRGLRVLSAQQLEGEELRLSSTDAAAIDLSDYAT
jgi:hypothetical protein